MGLIKQPIILSVDTSCDETSAAVTYGDKILSNVISSQVSLHKVWGGVVPDIAKRAHEEKIELVIEKALKIASRYQNKPLNYKDLDAVGVTYGPGLAIALEVGISKIKNLALVYKKPLIAVNHLEGHLLSCTAKDRFGNKGTTFTKQDFPLLGLIISGKHTEIVLVRGIGDYEVVGETLDDAIGEAYDKVGRMMDLGYPAGPVVSEFAKKGNPEKFSLPIPMKGRKDSLDFSFSGLKTAVYYKIKNDLKDMDQQDIYDMCASFEKTAILHLEDKLIQAIEKFNPKGIIVGGGVAASSKVRSSIRNSCSKYGLKTHFPYSNKLYMDNAGMIGVVAHYKYQTKEFIKNLETLDRSPRLNLS